MYYCMYALFGYLVCSGRKRKSVNEDLSLLINISYQTLQSAPLRMALFIIALLSNAVRICCVKSNILCSLKFPDNRLHNKSNRRRDDAAGHG